jgi:hypothetical protein
VNNKIIQKNAQKYKFLICIIIFLSIFNLSGCVSNQSTGVKDLDKFIGTWTGTLEIPMFGGINNSTVTQLIFMENIVIVDMTSERGNFTMNYTYNVEGEKLVLEPKFINNGGPVNRQPFNESSPFNDSRPPINESWPQNGTIPPNDTWSPNDTRPFNGEQLPYGQRPNMSISFIYSFNEEFNILYLDESQFIKIQ